jgi:hypothetical protein
MVTSVDARKCVGKRLLSDDTEIPLTLPNGEPNVKKLMTATTTFVARKLENIIGDRRTQNQ